MSIFMRFVRAKAIFILIALMSVLCIISVTIAFNITVSILKDRSNASKNNPIEVNKNLQSMDKLVNAEKLKEQDFFYNGEKFEGSSAYLTDRQQYLVPLNSIFEKLGVKFNYYTTDEILEAQVEGKKLTLQAGSDKFTYNGQDMYLTTIPLVSQDNFLVPIELFKYINWTSTGGYDGKNSVFMNYYQGYRPGSDAGIKAVRLNEKSMTISDVTGSKVLWEKKRGTIAFDGIKTSADGSVSALQVNGKSYMLYNGDVASLYGVNVSPSAKMADDGKSLYWIDEARNDAFTYNLETGKLEKIKIDYFKGNDGKKYGGLWLPVENQLKSIRNYEGFKRVVLKNPMASTELTYFERRNGSFTEYRGYYSPDGKKLLYFKEDNLWYISNSDGSRASFLGIYNIARWVTNTKILLKSEDLNYIYDVKTKEIESVRDEWRKIGQIDSETVLFQKKNTLYYEKKGEEKLIMELPFACDYVTAKSEKGPYIAGAGGKDDAVFLIKDGKITAFAKNSLLLDKVTFGNKAENKSGSFSFSPGNKLACALQNENGFVALNIIDVPGLKQRKILLDCPIDGGVVENEMKVIWLSDSRMLLCTFNQGWIIDLKDSVKIYKWDEPKGSVIFALIQ